MHESTTHPKSGAAMSFGVGMLVSGAVATWLLWRFFVDSATGQRLDNVALHGSEIGRSTLWRAAEPVLEIVNVPFVVLVLGSAAVLAVARRSWTLALQVTLLVGGANLTTQVLKRYVLERPEYIEAGANSLPSGHTTVAASIAAALVLMVPRQGKPLAALVGAAYAAITGVSTMVGGWHRPADVVAAITVVLAWSGVAILFAAEHPPTEKTRTSAGAATVGGLLAIVGAIAGVLAVIALRRTRDQLNQLGELTERDDLLTAYVGGALGVVSATALTFAAVLAAAHLVGRTHAPEPVGAVRA